MQEDFIFAFSLDNDDTIFSDHFGESPKFVFYKLTQNGFEFLSEKINKSPEERMHGDSNKAQAIMSIVQNADVLVAGSMGTNIQKIRQNFVPVITKINQLKKVQKLIQDNLELIINSFTTQPHPTVMLRESN